MSTDPLAGGRPIDIGWFVLRTQRQQLLLIPGLTAEFDAAIT